MFRQHGSMAAQHGTDGSGAWALLHTAGSPCCAQADLDSEMEELGGPDGSAAPAPPLLTLDLGEDGAWGSAAPPAAAAEASAPAAEDAAGGKLSKAQKKRAKADKEAAIRKAVRIQTLLPPHPCASWVRRALTMLYTEPVLPARGVLEIAVAHIPDAPGPGSCRFPPCHGTTQETYLAPEDIFQSSKQRCMLCSPLGRTWPARCQVAQTISFCTRGAAD